MAKEGEPNKDGLSLRVTPGGQVVCKLHYAADGGKNPSTKAGQKWMMSALQGYEGGVRNPNWKKEMEIFYISGGGQRVLPNWHEWQQNSNIFIDGDIEIQGVRLYGSYDHGFRNPSCYLVHAVYPDDLRQVIWEFYGQEVPVPMIAKIIKGETVQLQDGRVFEGNPYAGHEIEKICDPEIMRATQVMNSGPNKSVADLFRRDGVHFTRGSSGDDGTVAGWLTGSLWEDPFNPGLQIHRCCKKLIWELGLLQNKGHVGARVFMQNKPEKLLDKDNHAWDALKYFLKRYPVGVKARARIEPQADFAFWRDMGKHRSRFKKSYVRNFA